MTTKLTWTAVGIAMLTLAPATSQAKGHDAYTEMVPGCAQARVVGDHEVDPNVQYWDAVVENACDERVRLSGVAELWVDGRIVDAQQLDGTGRARLRHLQGSISTEPACVVVRGEQSQVCDHKVTDTPGHQRHAASFALQVEECSISAER